MRYGNCGDELRDVSYAAEALMLHMHVLLWCMHLAVQEHAAGTVLTEMMELQQFSAALHAAYCLRKLSRQSHV